MRHLGLMILAGYLAAGSIVFLLIALIALFGADE